MKGKGLVLLISATAIFGLSYGMIKENDTVFVLGLPFAIGAYLLIRRKLKESIESRGQKGGGHEWRSGSED